MPSGFLVTKPSLCLSGLYGVFGTACAVVAGKCTSSRCLTEVKIWSLKNVWLTLSMREGLHHTPGVPEARGSNIMLTYRVRTCGEATTSRKPAHSTPLHHISEAHDLENMILRVDQLFICVDSSSCCYKSLQTAALWNKGDILSSMLYNHRLSNALMRPQKWREIKLAL
jgi:hypothetical protein